MVLTEAQMQEVRDATLKQMSIEIIAQTEKSLEAVNAKLEEIAGKVGAIDASNKTEWERLSAELKVSLETMSSRGDDGAPPPGVLDTETGDPKCGYENLGSWVGDVIITQRNGFFSDPFKKYMKMADEALPVQRAAGTGLEVQDSEFGGFSMPEAFRSAIWMRTVEISNIMSKVFVIPVTTVSLTVPAMGGYDRSGGLLYGGIRFYDEGENDTTTETRPKFEQIKFELGLQMAQTNASDKMMQFSPISMETFIRERFSEALAWRIEYLLINGNGAEQPQGIIGSGATKTATAESGQGANTVVFENIAEMDIMIWKEQNAEWLYNREVKKQFRLMALAIGTAGSRVDWQKELEYPHASNEQCQALGTAGDLILGDWTQYGVILPQGQSSQPRFDTSIHFRFDAAQTTFRFMWYMDGKPMWRTVETPRHGSYNSAPFVILNSSRT